MAKTKWAAFKNELRQTWDRLVGHDRTPSSGPRETVNNPEVRERIDRSVSTISRDDNPTDFRRF
jgi:hypothetical protein